MRRIEAEAEAWFQRHAIVLLSILPESTKGQFQRWAGRLSGKTSPFAPCILLDSYAICLGTIQKNIMPRVTQEVDTAVRVVRWALSRPDADFSPPGQEWRHWDAHHNLHVVKLQS